MSAAPDVRPVEPRTDDDLVHITCCEDDSRALCGQSPEDWTGGPVLCGVCLDLSKTWFCPLGQMCEPVDYERSDR